MRVSSFPSLHLGTTHELIHGKFQLGRWKPNSREGFWTLGWVPNDVVGWAPLEMPGVSWTRSSASSPDRQLSAGVGAETPTGFLLSTRLHHSRAVLTACVFGALLLLQPKWCNTCSSDSWSTSAPAALLLGCAGATLCCIGGAMHCIHWSAAVFFLVLCRREETPCNAQGPQGAQLCTL